MNGVIRAAGPGDASSIRRIYAPFVESSPTSFESDVPTVDEVERRILEHAATHPWIVVESGSCVLGYAYASPHRARTAYQWSVEVSIYLDPGTRRRGVGRTLYGVLFSLLRRQGFVNAYAGITLPNPASVALHRSMGFAPVGVYPRIGHKFGTWHDVEWSQLRLQETPEPAPPRPAATLWSDPEVRELLRQESAALGL